MTVLLNIKNKNRIKNQGIDKTKNCNSKQTIRLKIILNGSLNKKQIIQIVQLCFFLIQKTKVNLISACQPKIYYLTACTRQLAHRQKLGIWNI